MNRLFEPAQISGITLRNRFVRSATYEGLADSQGLVTEKQLQLFKNLAAGGTGLIVTGIAYVQENGRLSAFQNSIATDDTINGWAKLVDTVHNQGAKVAIQLFHGGREARFVKLQGKLPSAPSVLEDDPFYMGQHRALNEDEIWEVVEAFGDSAVRAQDAGFDAVQVHGAHAYLLSQFLSPFTNRRQDNWGGSLENRLRLHFEIYKNIRTKVGNDFPIMIKIGVQDGFDNGLELSEGCGAAIQLAELGFECLEISQGLRGKKYEGTEYRAKIDSREKEAYYRDWCGLIRKKTDVPLIMVGGMRSVELMEEIVSNGEADFIALCRPLIREPNIINTWKEDPTRKPKCISCNRCVENMYKGIPLKCGKLKNDG